MQKANFLWPKAWIALLLSSTGAPSTAHAAPLLSLADSVEKVIGSVVNIQTSDLEINLEAKNGPQALRQIDRFLQLFLLPGQLMQPRHTKSLGSGFFYGKKSYVVTNHHVIKDAETIEIVTSSPQRRFSAQVLGFDEKADIAVLKVAAREGIKPLAFDKSSVLRIGEGVFAIGNPFGFGHTVTSGILSARGRTIGVGPYDEFLQTDAAINPGNSGGPLFNHKGELIGINTAVASDAQGISFAIPSEIAKPLIDEIIQKGSVQRPWFGVIFSAITEEKEADQDTYGIYVKNLAKDSPAEKSGIKLGDVILGINGFQVKDAASLEKILRRIVPGQRVMVRVYREGAPLQISLTAEQLPLTSDLRKMNSIF
jgi:serine protease Do